MGILLPGGGDTQAEYVIIEVFLPLVVGALKPSIMFRSLGLL